MMRPESGLGHETWSSPSSRPRFTDLHPAGSPFRRRRTASPRHLPSESPLHLTSPESPAPTSLRMAHIKPSCENTKVFFPKQQRFENRYSLRIWFPSSAGSPCCFLRRGPPRAGCTAAELARLRPEPPWLRRGRESPAGLNPPPGQVASLPPLQWFYQAASTGAHPRGPVSPIHRLATVVDLCPEPALRRH